MGRYVSSSNSNIALIVIICVVAAILLFFITRELWCWYYKINKRCTLLEQQNGLMRQLINEQVQANMMMSQLLAMQTGRAPQQGGPAAGQQAAPNMGQPYAEAPNAGSWQQYGQQDSDK